MFGHWLKAWISPQTVSWIRTGPLCCVSHALIRRGRPALRAPEHKQMFVKIDEQNNVWISQSCIHMRQTVNLKSGLKKETTHKLQLPCGTEQLNLSVKILMNFILSLNMCDRNHITFHCITFRQRGFFPAHHMLSALIIKLCFSTHFLLGII